MVWYSKELKVPYQFWQNEITWVVGIRKLPNSPQLKVLQFCTMPSGRRRPSDMHVTIPWQEETIQTTVYESVCKEVSYISSDKLLLPGSLHGSGSAGIHLRMWLYEILHKAEACGVDTPMSGTHRLKLCLLSIFVTEERSGGTLDGGRWSSRIMMTKEEGGRASLETQSCLREHLATW